MKPNNLKLNNCETFRFCISEAHNISDNKAAIKELLEKGGQVDMNFFDGGWSRNPIVATIWNDEILVACGALKAPTSIYKERLFVEKAKFDFPYDTINYELGWMVTDETYRRRGFCNNIVKMLLQCDGIAEKPLYATTRHDNNSMQKILKNNGFYQAGQPYQSERGDYKILLFVRNAKND